VLQNDYKHTGYDDDYKNKSSHLLLRLVGWHVLNSVHNTNQKANHVIFSLKLNNSNSNAHIKGTLHVHNIFSNLFFHPPRYEDFSSNNFKILYCPNITPQLLTASPVVWSNHLTMNDKILGSNPIETTSLLFNKALYYAILHFYFNN
jgi:hypothetical protein